MPRIETFRSASSRARRNSNVHIVFGVIERALTRADRMTVSPSTLEPFVNQSAVVRGSGLPCTQSERRLIAGIGRRAGAEIRDAKIGMGELKVDVVESR